MKKVLACDGGGIKGAATAQFLYCLEEAYGSSLFNSFDMFAGTSTGGLISLAIGVTEKEGEDLISLYSYENAQTIMDKSPWDRFLGLIQNCPKYDGIGKRTILNQTFGDKLLSDAKKPTMVTTYDLGRRQSCVLKSWSDNWVASVTAANAGDATSAAPAYYPPVKVKDKWLIDGGVVANNPSMCAYVEAKKFWPDEEIRLLSIGTGKLTRRINGHDACEYGAVSWMTHDLIGIFMDFSVVDYQCKTLLGNNYLRVDSELHDVDDEMDNVSMQNLKSLKNLGMLWWEWFGAKALDLLA